MTVNNIIVLVFEKNTRDSPVLGCISLIGLHIHELKDLISDNLFDPLSITKFNLIRNVNNLQGITLFQAIAASKANTIIFNVQIYCI